TAAAVGGWVVWAAVLLATLIPHPLGLTALRCATPGLLVATVAAAAGRATLPAAAVAVAWSSLMLILSLLPRTGLLFVNGPAYPNERRFPLALPGPLLLGPVEVAWLVVVGLPAAALFLLAHEQWVAGALATALAAAGVRYLGRPLHQLSRRWVVFVPAGLVLHDPMSLRDPVLFRRQVVESVGPAPVGTDALDLTQGALGLALELRLREKVPMTRITSRNRSGEEGASARLLFTPSRPGAVLAEATRRSIRVGA
ncbi:MAG TPA: hypothetical protein VGI06_15410, partial [Acidimicrobiales bacterium]